MGTCRWPPRPKASPHRCHPRQRCLGGKARQGTCECKEQRTQRCIYSGLCSYTEILHLTYMKTTCWMQKQYGKNTHNKKQKKLDLLKKPFKNDPFQRPLSRKLKPRDCKSSHACCQAANVWNFSPGWHRGFNHALYLRANGHNGEIFAGGWWSQENTTCGEGGWV